MTKSFLFGEWVILTMVLWWSLTGVQLHGGQLHGMGPGLLKGLDFDIGADVDRVVGDFDGDGLDDLGRVRKEDFLGSPDGTATVQLNTNGSFGGASDWHSSFATGTEVILAGDANGDGRDDLFAFTRGTPGPDSSGDVFVALSTGSGFGPKTKWHDTFCFGTEIPLVADVNGDGRDDVITFTRGTSASVYVATSTGSAFSGNGWLWHADFCPGEAVPKAGDVDGDGRDDIVAFYRDSQSGAARGDVYIARSSLPSGFGAAQKWHDFFCVGSEVPLVADLDADGMCDLLTFTRGASENVYTALSTGTAFTGTGNLWHDALCKSSQNPFAGHFNRDANEDIICLPTEGTGEITLSLTGGHAQPVAATEDAFGYGTLGVNKGYLPPLASRPAVMQVGLLVVLVEVPGQPTFASVGRPRAFWEQWAFGPGHPSLVNYFSEMSGGKLKYTRAGLVGPLQLNPAVAPLGDVRFFIKQKLRDNGFDFRTFDKNGDNIITNQELVILQVDNVTNVNGQTIDTVESVDHGGTSVVINGSVAAAGYQGSLDLYGHELSHTLGTIDFYGSGCYSTNLSLMHCNAAPPPNVVAVHLDAYHKMRLGWARPNAYDVRYPGGAFVANAQISPLTPSQPPVILVDETRGLHEYFLAEFRSKTWNSGQDVLPGPGPNAGYDSSVSETGVAVWYFNTNDAGGGIHNPISRRAAIRPGADRVLNTPVWPGSDDTIYNGSPLWFTSDRSYSTFITPGPDGILDSHPPYVVLPGPNGVIDTTVIPDDILSGNQILRGLDNILQSIPPRNVDDTLSLDDRYANDDMAFPSITPANYLSRRNTSLYQKADGVFSPQWFDNTSIGADIQVDEYGTTATTAFVQWGLPFVPWLTDAQGGNITAGVPFFLDGTMGIRDAGGPVPVLISGNGTAYEFEVMSWSGTRATLRAPLGVPDGPGRIVCYHDTSRSVESNSLPVAVENSFFRWVSAELGQLIGPDTDPDWSQPWFDFDGDGLPNFGEFLTGGRPGSREAALPYEWTLVPGQGLDIQWSYLGSRTQYGQSVMQFSVDLKSWVDLTPDSTFKINDRVVNTVSRPAGQKGYVRMAFRQIGQ